jgi:TonB family protein
MRRSAVAVLCVVMSGVAVAAEPTWKEANQRSAAALAAGNAKEGADFAREAFQLYEDNPNYVATNHGQLLLNLVDARTRAGEKPAALKEFEEGVARIEARAPRDLVLFQLWKEGVQMATDAAKLDRVDGYFEKAATLAEQLWGADDPRSIDLAISWVDQMRMHKGYDWAHTTLTAARLALPEKAANTPRALRLDLMLAQLELEHDRPKKAIPMYRTAIGKLEAQDNSTESPLLQSAYAQLEFAYERADDAKNAAEIRAHRVATFGPPDSTLIPLVRVKPTYPRNAAARKIGGVVNLEVTVAPDGRVAKLSVVNSKPAGVFDDAAMRAVKQWRFKPRIVNGQPVEQTGTQTLEFKMAN